MDGGAPRRNRTGTLLPERDFESRASTSSARGAIVTIILDVKKYNSIRLVSQNEIY